jgi:glutathione S-transferase
VNPFGKLPAIQCDDGTAVFESGAILLYLADRYGGLTTPEQRAVAAQWVVFANATFSPAMFNSSQRAQQARHSAASRASRSALTDAACAVASTLAAAAAVRRSEHGAVEEQISARR